MRQSWAVSRRGKALSPVGAGLWEETMQWRGRSQLPLWDRHKAAIRDRRQRVCPAWEVSCHGHRVVQGLGQNPPACSVALHTAPPRLAPRGGQKAQGQSLAVPVAPRRRGFAPQRWHELSGMLCACTAAARSYRAGPLPWLSPPSLAQPSCPGCLLNQLIKYHGPPGKQVA